MIKPTPEKSRSIRKIERKDDCLFLYAEKGIHRLKPMSEHSVRITYTEKEAFSTRVKPGVTAKGTFSSWEYQADEHQIILTSGLIRIVINRHTASYTYTDEKGRLLLQEKDRDSKILDPFVSYKLAAEEEIRTEQVQTADGMKEVIREAVRVPDETLYHTRLNLTWQAQEALYGLGQQEEGLLNLRGHTVFVHQANRKIAIPMLVSSLGYGLLMDTYSPMIFQDTAFGSYFYTDADDELDFYFINGGGMKGVIREYRSLTGKAAMLPRWAFGYIQSQERYENAEEIVHIAQEYRNRGLGLDCIVLDWMSWPDQLWGQKTFDPQRFPDPAEMIRRLHALQVHFMISIWPTMDAQTENYQEFHRHRLLLPASSVYNAFSEEGRRLYWKQAQEGLFRYGLDAWWCDSSEPFTPEWSRPERPDPAVLFAEYCRTVSDHIPARETNAYALFHAQAMYEGQRSAQAALPAQKRVVNLTRSGYTGQQRYGVILWSGDVEASWDCLRRQIASGLNFCVSGLPYWTTDIGAFFVKRGAEWFWKGDFPETTADMGYRELFVRWYQWACFLPIFRGHGTDCRRELWNFGNRGEMFYDALEAANHLRYTFLPYIYSQAGKVWLEDDSMIRMLTVEYPEDEQVWDLKDQYLFGDSVMVCPVTEPMYFHAGSVPEEDHPKKRKVYLPGNAGWYDYYTNTYYKGQQWIDAEADIDRIPLFVKAGSILPLAQTGERAGSVDSTCERQQIQFRVYTGCDSEYLLYEDEGDGYAYEEGNYQTTVLTWKEDSQELSAICTHGPHPETPGSDLLKNVRLIDPN